MYILTQNELNYNPEQQRIFWNSSVASIEGYQSKSQWSKQGRILRDNAVPSFVVFSSIIVEGETNRTVIKILGQDRYEVIDKGYAVFPVDQTEQTEQKTGKFPHVIHSNNNNTLPSIPSLSPTTIPESSTKSVQLLANKEVTTKNEISRNEKTKVYNPPDLDYLFKSDEWYKNYETYIRKLIHKIHVRHVKDEIPKDEFAPLKAEYLKKEIPWYEMKGRLLRDRVVETDGYYIKGHKSYGFRIGKHFRQSPKYITIQGTPEKEDKNKRPRPLHTWLIHNVKKIKVDETQPISEKLQFLIDGLYWFNSKDEFGQRFHSNLTNLKTTDRQALRVDGQSLVEIDIPNSQPLFLIPILQDRGIDCEKYSAIVHKDLYQYLADKAHTTRQAAKDAVIQVVFYGKPKTKHPIKTLFQKEFPSVYEFIHQTKAKDYTKLPKLLQRNEAKFILYNVCERIRIEKPDMFIATIHDSFLHLPQDSSYIQKVLQDEFKRLQLTPKLRIKQL